MSIATILADIDAFVNKEVSELKTDVSSWWTGFEPVLEADFEKFVTAMKPVALALVTGLAQAALDGPAKFLAASTALVVTAKAQGINATTTMANQLVQQIVTSLSAVKPPSS